MEQMILDEKNKKRIQSYIKQNAGFYGYEKDISMLEKDGILTEKLAKKTFIESMKRAQSIRKILTPKKDDEFIEQIDEAYSKYDKIPKPKEFEKKGFYDSAYRDMGLEDVYENMQVAFDILTLKNQYYGCRDLRNIANTAINSINGIDKYKIGLQPKVRVELQEIQEELKNLLAQKKTDIQSIQQRLDKYNTYAMDIWNDYLTSVDDTKSSEYRWVIHNLNKGELQGDFKYKYMSTSIITNNVMGVYGMSNYGLIIKPKHIVSASYKDTYTLNISGNEENAFNIRPPLMLPQEIEEMCMKKTIEKNGELLNYEKAPIYPEIVVDEFEIEGIYYISNGEHELARNYDKARKVAEERGIPLIERDISKYREEHGLEPMTENAKRSLCKNILQKCCDGDKNLKETYNKHYQDFVDTHFEEFYEQYMKLKEQGEYSKDEILRIFEEVTKEDIYFNKISQNADEMYLTDEEKEIQKEELEYETNNISNSKNQNLENVVSDGIFYGEDKQGPDKAEKFDLERMEDVVKETEELKQKSEIEQENDEQEQEQEQKQVDIAVVDVKIIEKEETKQDNTTIIETNEVKETIKNDNIEIPQKMQEVNNSTVDLWMNRFNSWYGAIDRVSQDVKTKFVKMKSEIIKAISKRIQERSRKEEILKNQEQNER